MEIIETTGTVYDAGPGATIGTDVPCACSAPDDCPPPDEPSPVDVRVIATPHGHLLYRHGRPYNHANGQPFHFVSRADALAADADEAWIEQADADADAS